MIDKWEDTEIGRIDIQSDKRIESICKWHQSIASIHNLKS